MEYNPSQDILQLDRPSLAEAYTTHEDFHLVAEAPREAQEAIQTLFAAGEKL